MSRVGKQLLHIPPKTEVSVDGEIVVKGPMGELRRPAHPRVRITIEEGRVVVSPVNMHDRLSRALWGTYASHIKNMLRGVHEPYEKKLEIEGIGYRASVSGTTLELLVGFSHPVRMEIPEGLEVTVEKNVISVKGIDKELVGQFAANVRAVRKPEPYKGKGIRYQGEYIIRKQGKRAA